MTIFIGDSLTWLQKLPSDSVDCIVTSPPYFGKRNYGVDGQIGLERTPELFVEKLMLIFREARRVLKPTGTCWINLGDSYWSVRGDAARLSNGVGKASKASRQHHMHVGGAPHPILKPKDMMFIPHRVALALQDDGWYMRNTIVWHKPAPMPESVQDRMHTGHEYVFMCTKSKQYNFQLPQDESRLDVWTINTESSGIPHYAVMPMRLAENCIAAGCPPGGMVLDPFGGAGTTALAAIRLGRKYQLIELNIQYVALAQQRIQSFDPYLPTPLAEGKQLSLFTGLDDGD